MIRACLAFVLFFMFWIPSASADVVEWTLQDLTFSDGGTGSGSFFYNADTGVYSSISITTTAGSGFPGASYTTYDPTMSSPTELWLTAPGPNPFPGLAFFDPLFSSPLTDAGGTITLIPGNPAVPAGEGFFFPGNTTFLRDVATGAVSSVPEPSAVVLVTLTLLVVLIPGLLARKQGITIRLSVVGARKIVRWEAIRQKA